MQQRVLVINFGDQVSITNNIAALPALALYAYTVHSEAGNVPCAIYNQCDVPCAIYNRCDVPCSIYITHPW